MFLLHFVMDLCFDSLPVAALFFIDGVIIAQERSQNRHTETGVLKTATAYGRRNTGCADGQVSPFSDTR